MVPARIGLRSDVTTFTSVALAAGLTISSVSGQTATPQTSPDQGGAITKRLVETRQHSGSNDLVVLEQLLKDNPNDFRLHFALGRAYESIGMQGLAEQEDEVCDKSGPEFHKYVLTLFKDRVRRRDYASATTLFRYVDRHYPADPSVLLIGAIILDHQGRLAEAEDSLRRILESNPEEPGVYTFYGYLRLREDRLADAENFFNLELKQRPAFEEAAIGKGKVAERQGRYSTALNSLVPYFREDPVRKGMADSVAECLAHTGFWGDAAEPSLFALAAATKDAELKRAKNRVILIWPRLSRAVRERAIHVMDDFFSSRHDIARAKHFHFAFADSLQKCGLWREAKSQFARGLKIDPEHARAYYHLGEIAQFKEHDYPNAALAYLRAFELTPPEDKGEKEFRDQLQHRIHRLARVVNGDRENIAARIKVTVLGGSFKSKY